MFSIFKYLLKTMSKTASIPVSYCVFLHQRNSQDFWVELYHKIYKKYNALALTAESMTLALDHCSNRYGLFITQDTSKLLELLNNFNQELANAKIWIINLGEHTETANPSYIISIKSICIDQNLLSIAFKEIKKEIKGVLVDIRKYMTQAIKAQKVTTEQQQMVFLEKLWQVFAQHYSNRKLRTPFLATQLGVSVSTLERKCEKITGKLPGQLLTQYRLEKARELISNTSMRMSSIAVQTGFGSSSYFSVRFAEYFGVTPSQYKNQRQKKAS